MKTINDLIKETQQCKEKRNKHCRCEQSSCRITQLREVIKLIDEWQEDKIKSNDFVRLDFDTLIEELKARIKGKCKPKNIKSLITMKK